jgi:hypothetical protein
MFRQFFSAKLNTLTSFRRLCEKPPKMYKLPFSIAMQAPSRASGMLPVQEEYASQNPCSSLRLYKFSVSYLSSFIIAICSGINFKHRYCFGSVSRIWKIFCLSSRLIRWSTDPEYEGLIALLSSL